MSQIVRYKKGRVVFEVVTKPGSVRKYRAGKLGWNNVLIADQVFSNFKIAWVGSVFFKQIFFGFFINNLYQFIVHTEVVLNSNSFPTYFQFFSNHSFIIGLHLFLI